MPAIHTIPVDEAALRKPQWWGLVHFIYVTPHDQPAEIFPLIFAIAIKSFKIVNPTYKLVLHANVVPTGPYWEFARRFVTLEPVEIPTMVFGTPIVRIEHRVDVLRLEILLRSGGAYIDLDTICLKPLDHLFSDVVVMGKEGELGLCNAVIFSPPQAKFIEAWHDHYRAFHNDQWNEFSVALPMRLSKEMPSEITVKPPQCFYYPSFSEAGLASLFRDVAVFPDAYLLHLWNFCSRKQTQALDCDQIFSVETTYNLAARKVIGLDRELLMPLHADADTIVGKEDVSIDIVGRADKAAEIFGQVYAMTRWGHGSGNGSHPASTSNYRIFLERFIGSNQIRSVLDVGCGDWQSSRFINFGTARYLGFDVVKKLVEHNQTSFSSDAVEFAVMPDDPRRLPPADLIIIKDVLQHLPDDQIMFYRDHVLPKYRFCLITNSFAAINYKHNVNIGIGEFRTLNLLAPPYAFKGAFVSEDWNQWERILTLLMVH